MAESIQAVHVEFTATTKPLQAEMKRGQAAVARFGTKFRRNMKGARGSSKSLASSFRGLNVAIAAAGVAAGLFVRDMIRVGVASEKASGVIAGLGKNVRENIGLLNRSARELVLDYGAVLSDTQDAQTSYISATQDVIGANAAVAESLKLAIAGGFDAKTTMDALTTIMGTYSIEGGRAAEVSEALFRAYQRGKLTMDEISSSIVNVAASARAAGVSYQEMLASLASVSSGGLGGEATRAGATSLARLFDAVSKASPKVIALSREMAEAAGVVDFEFSKAQLATDGLSKFLKKLSRVIKGDLLALTNLGIQAKAAKGTLILLKDGAKATTANMDDQARAANELGDAMEFMGNTAGMAAKRLAGASTIFKTELFEQVLEPWKDGLKGVEGNYDDIADAARRVAGVFNIFATVVGLWFDVIQVEFAGFAVIVAEVGAKVAWVGNKISAVSDETLASLEGNAKAARRVFGSEFDDLGEDIDKLGAAFDQTMGLGGQKAGGTAMEKALAEAAKAAEDNAAALEKVAKAAREAEAAQLAAAKAASKRLDVELALIGAKNRDRRKSANAARDEALVQIADLDRTPFEVDVRKLMERRDAEIAVTESLGASTVAVRAQYDAELRLLVARQDREELDARLAIEADRFTAAMEEQLAIDREREQLARDLASRGTTFADLFGLPPEKPEETIKGATAPRGFQLQMQSIEEHLLTVGELGAGVASSLAGDFADAFTDFATGAASAEVAFKQFARTFLTDIARMITQQLALNAMSGFLGSIGVQTATEGAGAGAGAAAAAGPGKMAGGGATVNIANYSGAEVKASTSMGPSGPQVDLIIAQVVSGDLERGGPISRTLDRTRGTRRRGRRG